MERCDSCDVEVEDGVDGDVCDTCGERLCDDCMEDPNAHPDDEYIFRQGHEDDEED